MPEWKNPPSLRARSTQEQDIIDNIWKTKKNAAYFKMMTGLPQDELESVARMCLMKSAKSYKPEKPANFSTWVNRCLPLHLLNFLRDKSRLIKMPRKYTEIYLKIRKLYKEDPDMTLTRAAKILELPIEDIQEVYSCFNSKILDIYYFEEEVLGGGDGDIDEYLYDQLFSLFEEDLNDSNRFYSREPVDNLTEVDKLFLDVAVVRGLCDNTLQRRYKKPISELMERVDDLLDHIYFNS